MSVDMIIKCFEFVQLSFYSTGNVKYSPCFLHHSDQFESVTSPNSLHTMIHLKSKYTKQVERKKKKQLEIIYKRET